MIGHARLSLTGRVLVVTLLTLLWGQNAHAFPRAAVVTPVVHRTYSHDPTAFTQGLLFWQGRLFESTGIRGRSSLRRVELATGRVEQRVALHPHEFGEGLARVDDKLIQLTWTAGKAHVYALETLTPLQTFEYTGQGWGLCFDGQRLIMSDGSDSLFFRNSDDFALRGAIRVTRDGKPLARLNELECVEDFVYANVWQTNEIVKIDPKTGLVLATIDAAALLTSAEARAADVLNGIAYDPKSQRFFITGKLWPKLFEVTFPGPASPQAAATAAQDPSSTPPPPSGPTTAPAAPAPAKPAGRPPPAPRALGSCRCALSDDGAADGLVGSMLATWWCFRRRRQCRRDLPVSD